jgi:hypothetical protein
MTPGFGFLIFLDGFGRRFYRWRRLYWRGWHGRSRHAEELPRHHVEKTIEPAARLAAGRGPYLIVKRREGSQGSRGMLHIVSFRFKR